MHHLGQAEDHVDLSTPHKSSLPNCPNMGQSTGGLERDYTKSQMMREYILELCIYWLCLYVPELLLVSEFLVELVQY
jgi:hypothetical protein